MANSVEERSSWWPWWVAMLPRLVWVLFDEVILDDTIAVGDHNVSEADVVFRHAGSRHSPSDAAHDKVFNPWEVVEQVVRCKRGRVGAHVRK
jgi:hypothetical protein